MAAVEKEAFPGVLFADVGISVGDPQGSPAAGECFSDASIANTIRADDQEVGDRAEGRYIL